MIAIIRNSKTRKESKKALDKAQHLLEFVGLQGLGDQLARNLPYGAQRRLEIARALGSDPKLLLLDEPTAGMNPHESAEMTTFIKRLRDELNITILLIEHDMRVVMGNQRADLCAGLRLQDRGRQPERNPDQPNGS